MLRSRRSIIWMIVLAVVAAVLAFVPLFDVLGFEFSFVIGIVASFATADLASARVRAESLEPSVARLFAGAAGHGLVLLVPPLAVISLNALRVPSCDFAAGLRFYLVLPGVSVLMAAAAGVFLALLLRRWPRLAAVAPWLFILGSIVVGVVRFYTGPPIFGYDPFVGWFPGALYDEDLVITTALGWSRVYQGAVALAALAIAETGLRPRWAPALLALAAVLGATQLRHRSAELGFAVTSEDIARSLGGRRETEHFVIVYPKGASFEPLLPAIALDHELRWQQVVAVFGVAPAGKITSFYFSTPEEKERWMGAESTYIAKPWRHEIYLSHEGFPHGSLRHEIAHVVAGQFGDPLFHVSVSWWGWPPARFNVGLIEGAAVAADWPGLGRLTPHESVRAMRDLGFLPPLRSVLATGFLTFSPAQSYTVAGSFCRFLLERHGAERFRAIYRAGGRPDAFPRVYGRSLDELEADWRAFIATVPLPDEEREIARERFRRRGIFSRPCPHAIARRARRAHELAAAGRPDEALPILREVCAEDPAEPGHRLDLADTAIRAGRPDEAEQIYQEIAGDGEVTTLLRARALLGVIDLAARAGRLDGARAALTRAEALPVDENTQRQLVIRRLALGDAPDASALRAYVFERGLGGADPDATVLLERARRVGGALGDYLAGRILGSRAGYAEAAAALARAQAAGLANPLMAREADRQLVVAAYLAGDLPLARAAAGRLAAEGQPPAARRLAADWLARLDFAEFAGKHQGSR